MARSFNGSSDLITITHAASINPAHKMTISAWANYNSLGANSYNGIISCNAVSGSAYFFGGSGTSNKLSYYFGTSPGIDPGSHTLTSGTWYHIAATYDDNTGGNLLTGYVNGASDGTASAGTITYGTNNTKIGIGGNAGQYWNGSIDDVTIWNGILLTAGEILALAQGVRPSKIRPNSLGAWWPLGLASPEPDLSGNQNSGTLTGTALAGGAPINMLTPRPPQFLTPPAAGFFARYYYDKGAQINV